MEIISDAKLAKDIISKKYVDEKIENHTHKAEKITANLKKFTLGNKTFSIGENVQGSLENLLDYAYMNGSGVASLESGLAGVSNKVNSIPDYKGGTGIVIAGDTIGHSNSITAKDIGYISGTKTIEYGSQFSLPWISVDSQGHICQSGQSYYAIETADSELSATSTKPVQNKVINTALLGKSNREHTHSNYENQDAFSAVSVGNITIWADTPSDVLTLEAGANVTLAADTVNDKVTISSTDTKNTAGSTQKSDGYMYLVAAPTQADGTKTYSNERCYIADNCLYSNGNQVLNCGVDTALSGTSTNPVQNKAVYSALNGKSDSGHTHSYAGASSAGGAATSANKLATATTIDGMSFDGTSAISHYGTCTTAAATAAKVVTLAGFILVTGAKITVRFTVTNTADNVTLNVNGTGAKPVYYSNGAATPRLLKLNANILMDFIYDGTNWVYDGQMSWTSQSNTTVNEERRLLLSTTADDEQDRGALSKSAKFTANPSTGVLTAPYIKTTGGGKILASGGFSSSSSPVTITIADASKYEMLIVSIRASGIYGTATYINGTLPIKYMQSSHEYIKIGPIVTNRAMGSGGAGALYDISGYVDIGFPSATSPNMMLIAMSNPDNIPGIDYTIYAP